MRDNLDTFASKSKRGTILIFGPPKTGKSYALYSLLKMGLKPGWVFDFDYGLDPLINQARRAGMKGDDIIRFTYGPKGGDRVGKSELRPRGQGKEVFLNWLNDFNSLFDMLNQDFEWKDASNAPAWIAFDSITTFMEIILDFVLEMGGHDLNAPKTDARADYGKQMGKIQEIAKSCATLPCLTIFNCHEKNVENEQGQIVRTDPMITGQLSGHFAKDFGVVLHTKTVGMGDNTKYKWETKPMGFVRTAGSRFRDDLKAEVDQDFALVL